MVDHKKIKLSPEDLEKLKDLLAKAEDSVDAMSDFELESEEKALEARIRGLPVMQGAGSDQERIDASWKMLQDKIDLSSSAVAKASQGDNVLSISKKRKPGPWTALGALAAAALALLVFYPAVKNQPPSSIELDKLQTKGIDNQGRHAYTAFCDVDVGDLNANEVDPDSKFTIVLSCDRPGYLQVWSKTSPKSEVRNFIVEGGASVEFTLSGAALANLGIALTDKVVSDDSNLLELPLPAERIGDASVLWADSIVFREKKR